MITLHQVLLNPEYSALARGGPESNTSFSNTNNNVPQVNLASPDYVGKYVIDYEEMEEEERIGLRDFIVLRRNNAYAFLMIAPDNYEDNQKGVWLKADRSVAAVVEAGVHEYYMAQLYQDSATLYKRRIIKPSPGNCFDGDLGTTLFLNEVPMALVPAPGLEQVPLYGESLYGEMSADDSGLVFDYQMGKLTMTDAASVQYAGQAMRWAGSFFIPAIFTSKSTEIAIDPTAISSGKGINVMELLPIALGISL